LAIANNKTAHPAHIKPFKELSELQREMIRRARPAVFEDARWDEMTPEEQGEALLQAAVDVLPDALLALGRTRFHLDEIDGEDVHMALLATAIEGLMARATEHFSWVRTGEWRIKKKHYRTRQAPWHFCGYCGAPFLRYSTTEGKAKTRFCSRSCSSTQLYKEAGLLVVLAVRR